MIDGRIAGTPAEANRTKTAAPNGRGPQRVRAYSGARGGPDRTAAGGPSTSSRPRMQRGVARSGHQRPPNCNGPRRGGRSSRSGVARERLDEVFVGDIEGGGFREWVEGAGWIPVICGDVLEHLDPWGLMDFLAAKATITGAVFISSLPNVAHWSSIAAIWGRGTWPRNERGIHDQSHLRWFTERDACRLHEDSGLTIETIRRKNRLVETIHPFNGGRIERLLRPILGSLLVHQILIRAFKR